MALSLAQKFINLGMASPLAVEFAAQLTAGVYNWRRLMWLGMIPALAKYTADSLTAGTFDPRIAAEKSMSEAVAVLTKSAGAVVPMPAIDLDFVNNVYQLNGATVPFEMAATYSSVQSRYADQMDTSWLSFAPGVLPRTDKGVLLRKEQTNFLLNSGAAGGTDGTGATGSNPTLGAGTTWGIGSNGTAGLTRSIDVGVSRSGLPGVLVGWSGTGSATTSAALFDPMALANGIAAVAGETVDVGAWLSWELTPTGFVDLKLIAQGRTSADGGTADATTATITPNTTMTRYNAQRLLNGGTTAKVTEAIRADITAQTYSGVLFISMPYISKTGPLVAPILTTTTAVTVDADNLVLKNTKVFNATLVFSDMSTQVISNFPIGGTVPSSTINRHVRRIYEAL